MQVTKGVVRVHELPLRTPFRTALRATSNVTDIRLVLETDEGLRGFGSASPTPAITGETTESIVSAIQNYILPSLEGVPLEESEEVFARIHRAIVKNHAAKAAVDICPYVDLDAAYFLMDRNSVGGVSYQAETIHPPKGVGIGVFDAELGEVTDE